MFLARGPVFFGLFPARETEFPDGGVASGADSMVQWRQRKGARPKWNRAFQID